MAQYAIMPKLGLTMTRGTIVRWFKKIGEQVEVGDDLFEFETDKAAFTVQSEASGILLDIYYGEGEEAAVLSNICRIGNPDEKGEDSTVESGTTEPVMLNREVGKGSDRRIKASPLAKKIAADNGIDLSSIIPSDGVRISSKDVLAALDKTGPASKPSGESAGAGSKNISAGEAPKTLCAPAGEGKALTGSQKVIAEKMSLSKSTIPHVYFRTRVCMDKILELREVLSKKSGGKIGFTSIITRITALVLREFPLLHALYMDDLVWTFENVNINIAMDTRKGLVVPVIRNAEEKTAAEIERQIRAYADKANGPGLSIDDVCDGNFTISNLGMYGIDSFCAVINPPQTAILAISKISEQAVVQGGSVTVLPVMEMVLSADHRVIDGAMAAKFMTQLKESLEVPGLLLLQ